MKRINRNPARYEVLNLFESIARERGFSLGEPVSAAAFVDTVKASLHTNSLNPIVLHGLRVQSMFEHVAAGLGRVLLIKREDAGEIAALDPQIQPPDFRLILDDRRQLLVEVKNCHDVTSGGRFSMRLKDAVSLERYADLMGLELRVAIYWSRWRAWTLLAPNDFDRGKKVSIEFTRAMKKNKMAEIGDLMIATTPPLALRFIAKNPSAPDSEGNVKFTIGGVEYWCGGKKVDLPEEQHMALYFMLHSSWEGSEPTGKFDDEKLRYLEYAVSPAEVHPGQGFEMLGSLSAMISRAYNEATSKQGMILRLSPSDDPGELGVIVPRDYKGTRLPLWRFNQQPAT